MDKFQNESLRVSDVYGKSERKFGAIPLEKEGRHP